MLRRLLDKIAPRRAKVAEINAAYEAARDRYRAARKAGDTRRQHEAAEALQAAQTARLRLEVGR